MDAHGFFFPPYNQNFRGPENTLPPLIVNSHGGPTGHFSPGLSLETQYFTSRGYAVILVNYRGSSAHGGPYRDALNSKWGLYDTDDMAYAVKCLASQGKVDASRAGIRGGSAGGYAVLQSITQFPEAFAGAVSNYGISSLKGLIDETHKFESLYMDNLLFTPGMSEEDRTKVVRERSPINYADRIKTPLLLLHGSVDKVVPPGQSEMIRDTILSRNGTTKMVVFEGEGHGFRQAKNRMTALEEEEAWWRKTLVRNE
jgi:dipeptidyl aminopeptidase/acylaminoacyl peptidase